MLALGGRLPRRLLQGRGQDGRHVPHPRRHALLDPRRLGQGSRDGSIQLLGRGSQCINTAGEKVFPEEVEEALKTHPTVHDACVLGVPDERWGEVVMAVVELRDGTVPTEAALIDHVRTRLAHYKAPRRVRVESVLRSPSGKMDYAGNRASLVAWLAEQHA